MLDEAETVAERVLQSLTTPFLLGAQHIVLSASIGIAIGDVSFTASSMMRDADVAMYKAKTTGKSKWALYEPAMRTEALNRLETLIHPFVGQAVDFLVKRAKSPYVVLEAIKLLESGTAKDCDAVWVVSAGGMSPIVTATVRPAVVVWVNTPATSVARVSPMNTLFTR